MGENLELDSTHMKLVVDYGKPKSMERSPDAGRGKEAKGHEQGEDGAGPDNFGHDKIGP